MRIYEVTFDYRPEDVDEWSPNWNKVKVGVEDGAALAAIDLATVIAGQGSGSFELRPAEVRVLAEAP